MANWNEDGQGGGGEAGGTYHLQLAGGKVVGPFPVPMIQQMVKMGRLKGEEGVSRDRETWLPILSVPEFASLFDGGAPASSAAAEPGRPRTMMFGAADVAALAPPAAPAGGAPWMREAAGDDDDAPLDLPKPVRSTITRGPLTPDERAPNVTFGQKDSESKVASLFGSPDDLPARARTGSLAPITGPLAPVQHDPFGEDLPTSVKPRPTGISDLPISAAPPTGPRDLEDLPGRATGGLFSDEEDLPAPVRSDAGGAERLEGLVGTMWDDDLPTSAGGGVDLPGRQASDLPGRQASDLPGRQASDLPAAATILPKRQGGVDWPAEQDFSASPTVDVEELGDDELEAVAPEAGGGDFALSDFWQPSATGATQALRPPSELLNAPMPGASEGDDVEDLFGAPGAEPDAAPAPSAPAKGGPGGSSFDEFFSGDGEAPGLAQPAQQAAPSAGVSAGGASRIKTDKSRRLIVVGAGLVGVLALAVVATLVLRSGGEAEEEAPVARAETVEARERPAVVERDRSDLPTMLRRGNHRDFQQIVSSARQRSGRRSPEEDAMILRGLAMAAVDFPEIREASGAASDLFEALTEAQATETLQLGRGAYLAARGDEGALPVLSLLLDTDEKAWASLLMGYYHVQTARGVVSGDAEPPDRYAALEEARRAFREAGSLDPSWGLPQYWRGVVSLEMSDLDEAFEALGLAVERAPDHVGSLLARGELMKRRGEIRQAEELIAGLLAEHSSASSPRQRAEAHRQQAHIAFARFAIPEAIESMKVALQQDGRHPDLVNELSEFYEISGQHAAANDFFSSSSVSSLPSLEVGLALANAEIGLQRWEAAERRLERLRGQASDDARAVYLLGRVAEGRTRFDRARTLYEESLRIDPEFIAPEIRLVELDRRGNRRGEALERLDRLSRRQDRTSRETSMIADRYAALGDLNQAARHYVESVERDRANSQAWLALITYYVEGGEYRRALVRIDELQAAGGDHAVLTFERARALHGLGRHDRAIEEMLRLIDAHPEVPEYEYQLGRIHFSAGNFASARERLASAYERSPSLRDALLWMARADMELGNLNDALSSLTTVAARGDSGLYRYWLARALLSSGQSVAALDELNRVIETDPMWALENPRVFTIRGQALLEQNATEAAFNDIRIAVTLRPLEAVNQYLLGRVYFQMRRFPEAIARLQRALALDEENADAHYFLGLAYLNERDNQRALPALQRAERLRVGETRPDLFLRLGYAYRDLGQGTQAAAAFRAYLDNARVSPNERREIENQIRRLGQRP